MGTADHHYFAKAGHVTDHARTLAVEIVYLRRLSKAKPVRRYHAEIDSSLSPDERETRVKISKSYAKARFEYRVLLRHYEGPWVCERWPMCVLPFLGTKAFKVEHWRLSLMARFDNEIRQIKKRLTTAENAAVRPKKVQN